MQTIKEATNSFGAKYDKFRDNQLIKSVQIVSLQNIVDGYEYFLLLDNCKKVIFESYEYINFYLQSYSYKKRELATNALKVFFTFVELFNIVDYKCLDRNDLYKLVAFLEGGYSTGTLMTFDIKTTRCSKTINMYLSIYRQFFKFIKAEDNIFDDKGIAHTFRSGTGFLAHANHSFSQKYNSNVSEIKEKRIPKYIKFKEYKMIMNLIDNNDSKFKLRNKLIIKLMYEYGFRISEVLGLTVEDLEFDISNLAEDTKGFGRIILRNRVSDNQYHYCKNLRVPKTTSEYNSPNYKTEGYGYRYVIVTLETLNLIQDYIDSTMDPFDMSSVALDKIKERVADKVTSNPNIKDNYYIFISKNYTPLTSDGWNKVLREIFTKVGIVLDYGVRENNLNHRFRHGFAMYLKYLGYSRLEIMKKLRHTKVSSVDVYFNPDIEDDIEMAKDASSKSRKYLGINL